METGSISVWNLKEGESFAAGDSFCEIETDKATMDFEAQDDGFIAKILAQAGPADLAIGDPVMITVEDEGDVAAFADYKLEAAAQAPAAPAPEAAAPPAPVAAAPAPVATAPTPPLAAAASAAPPAAAPIPAGGRVVASPLAHMLAKQMGFDILMITGSGPRGRILAADVKEFVPLAATAAATTTAAAAAADVATPAPAQAVMVAAPPIAGAGYTDYPLSESAKEVAARLMQAKRNVPHYYLTVDISMDELLKTRAGLNKTLGEDEHLGTYELILKAAAKSMKVVPSANASWMDSVVRVYDSVDINVVIGSGDSLYTPVLRDCASKGLKSISKELGDAVAALEPVEGGAEAPAALGGLGTFTVMNLGMYGIKSCAPIIREPQACALAVGAMENRIVPNDDPDSEEIYKESVVMTATLSCDHRVVDGAVGAQWLAAFKSHVENPSTLLL
jgi:pyruvate dehydrogenase E2 component (dihydrolipoamide acetyltransferase)